MEGTRLRRRGQLLERHPSASTYLVLALLVIASIAACGDGEEATRRAAAGERLPLVAPRQQSATSVEEAMFDRRSVRDYTGEELTLAEVSQLLWAAQGLTDPRGFRTAPSAGALYPLEVYVVVGDVTDLTAGVYRYLPAEHEIVRVADQDRRQALAEAAVDQEWVAEAAVDLVVTAVAARTTEKYGDRGIRYVYMEAGHAAQNVYLQADALGLGVTVIGAFDDARVLELVEALPDEQPLYVISVGRPA